MIEGRLTYTNHSGQEYFLSNESGDYKIHHRDVRRLNLMPESAGLNIKGSPKITEPMNWIETGTLFCQEVEYAETCYCCEGTTECQGIATRDAGGKGCDCESFEDCPTLGLCVLCGMDEKIQLYSGNYSFNHRTEVIQ